MVPLPEVQGDPGFAGSWRADVLGQEMTLRINPFLEGQLSTNGRLAYGDGSVDWPIQCQLVPDGENALDVDCSLTVDEEPPTCSLPAGETPRIEIVESVPRIRLIIDVGGNLRQGTAAACDGSVIVNWDPSNSYTFVPA